MKSIVLFLVGACLLVSAEARDPLIVSHRGARCEFDDNAAGGFAWSYAKGIRGFETDVRFSKDHALVIMHDTSVNRTTDGCALVEDLTLQEYRKLRIRNCAEPVPTLDDLADVLKGRTDFLLAIELNIRPDRYYTPPVIEEYCRKVDALARSRFAKGTYLMSCFEEDVLRVMRKVNPEAPLSYITNKPLTREVIDRARAIGCTGIDAKMLPSVTAADVRAAKAAGLSVCLWMVQDAADYARAKALGADRVTTDYPNLLARAVAGRPKKAVAVRREVLSEKKGGPVSAENAKTLKALCGKYACAVLVADGAAGDGPELEGIPVEVVRGARDGFDAASAWAKRKGVFLDDLVFIGDDFADTSPDARVRTQGVDRLVITEDRNFGLVTGVLLK